MNLNLPPKFRTKPLNPVVLKNIKLSSLETEDLMERDVKCPYCDTIITKVFSDAKGHFRIKCQKCKAVTVLNLTYFRTMKGYGQYKSKYSSK